MRGVAAPVLAKTARRFDSSQQEVYLNLWRTYDRLRVYEDELFARHDLTAQQYNALRLLRAASPGPLPTLTLAARLISRAPDITRLVDKLVRRGLVHRDRPADNRRVVNLAITPAGLELLDQLARDVHACHQHQLGHLSPDEMAHLVDLLKKARGPHEPAENGWT